MKKHLLTIVIIAITALVFAACTRQNNAEQRALEARIASLQAEIAAAEAALDADFEAALAGLQTEGLTAEEIEAAEDALFATASERMTRIFELQAGLETAEQEVAVAAESGRGGRGQGGERGQDGGRGQGGGRRQTEDPAAQTAPAPAATATTTTGSTATAATSTAEISLLLQGVSADTRHFINASAQEMGMTVDELITMTATSAGITAGEAVSAWVASAETLAAMTAAPPSAATPPPPPPATPETPASPLTDFDISGTTLIAWTGSRAPIGSSDAPVIVIPSFVTEIGERAFINLAMTSITGNSVTTIGREAFALSKVFNASFPSLTSLGDAAFRRSMTLESIYLPKVTTVGAGAFEGAGQLTSINFPEATVIGRRAFQDCRNLTSAYLPKVHTIGDQAFSGCVNLVSLYIPWDGIIISSPSAFDLTRSLANITLGNHIPPPSLGRLPGNLWEVYRGAGTYVTDNPGHDSVWRRQ